MFSVLKNTKLNGDVNSHIFGMIKDLSLEEKIKQYPQFLELFEHEKDVNKGMHYAAKSGHQSLVNFFIDGGANCWSEGMKGASEGGHLSLVKFFISKEATNWIDGIYYSAMGGHRELVDFFICNIFKICKKNSENRPIDGWEDYIRNYKVWGMNGCVIGGHKDDDLINFIRNHKLFSIMC